MSCSKFKTEIALYAGGDLPPGSIARVEAHLAECADCRALAEELRDGQALLSELREEPLEVALVAAVRHRVLAEVRRAKFSPRGALAPLLALAAAMILAAVLFWPRHHSGAAPRAARPLGPASHAAQAEAGRGPAAAPEAAPLARKGRRQRRAPAAQPGPPLLVQFVTDDPNIVVYWLIDQKPQGD